MTPMAMPAFSPPDILLLLVFCCASPSSAPMLVAGLAVAEINPLLVVALLVSASDVAVAIVLPDLVMVTVTNP